MKKVLKASIILMAAIIAATGCEKENQKTKFDSLDGLIVLNNGNWGSNDSSIGYYDGTMTTAGYFYQNNNVRIGDLGQDMIQTKDGRIFIAASGSKMIYVCDSKLNLKESISLEWQPRYFATDGNDVYVTLYEGYLGKIEGKQVKTTKVGPNPEGVAILNGKAYVANSGGYVEGFNNTLSVVDLKSFTETSTITVNCNPKDVKAINNKIYVSSLGNYKDIMAGLEVYNPSDGSCSKVDIENPYALACNNKTLYVLSSYYDSNWNTAGCVHSIENGKINGPLTEEIQNVHSVSCTNDGFAIGISDYKTEGSVMLYKSNGEFINEFQSLGMNPVKVLDLR